MEKGSKITKPRDPKRDGYIFKGWYRDSKLEKEWDFGKDEVNSDITLYAKWMKKSVSTGDVTNTSLALATLLAALVCGSYVLKKRKEQ